MRQVRDVLRLNAAGVSGNEIARRVGVAPSTVRLTLKRLAVAGLGCPLPAEMTDAAWKHSSSPRSAPSKATAAAPSPTGPRFTAS